MKAGKSLGRAMCVALWLRWRPSLATSSLQWEDASIVCLLPAGGWIAVSPPVASIGTDFSTTCGIACSLGILLLHGGGGSEASYDTLSSLGDKDTSSALESSLSNASSFLEFDHIFFVSSVYSFPRSCDPMVEEAALGASVGTPCRSCNEEVVSMVEQPTNPPPTTLSLCLSNLLLPIEDIQTPVMFRSEDEQLAGHELIKALRNFKLSSVSPLSPSNRHEPSLNNEAIVVHSKETQSCYP
jgi:hypothetical protein